MPARFKVRITRAAETDIQAIWSYIAEDSPANADQFILEIEKQSIPWSTFLRDAH